MADAAHPQPDAELARDAEPELAGVHEPEPMPDEAVAKNPFPTSMTVPHIDGGFITVDLAVVDGVVYAPRLNEAPINPGVRQYITQYCAAWSSSVLTAGKLDASWPAPPRRAQLIIPESQLHALLGLAPDERLLRVDYDARRGSLGFIVESPRLPEQPFWDGGPPVVTLPIAAYYEGRLMPQ